MGQLFLIRQENLELLKADQTTNVWLAYVDYVDELVVDGFYNTIVCTVRFMLENTDANTTSEPLYEAIVELHVSDSAHDY